MFSNGLDVCVIPVDDRTHANYSCNTLSGVIYAFTRRVVSSYITSRKNLASESVLQLCLDRLPPEQPVAVEQIIPLA